MSLPLGSGWGNVTALMDRESHCVTSEVKLRETTQFHSGPLRTPILGTQLIP